MGCPPKGSLLEKIFVSCLSVYILLLARRWVVKKSGGIWRQCPYSMEDGHVVVMTESNILYGRFLFREKNPCGLISIP